MKQSDIVKEAGGLTAAYNTFVIRHETDDYAPVLIGPIVEEIVRASSQCARRDGIYVEDVRGWTTRTIMTMPLRMS